MALINLDAFEVIDVRAELPVFAELSPRACPLCGVLHAPTEFRVATVRVVGRPRPFDVLLCLDCITQHVATPDTLGSFDGDVAARG